MAHGLEEFGWDGIHVPTQLKDIVPSIPTIKHLKILRSPQTMSGEDVYFPFKFFHHKDKRYMPAYIKDVQINDGGYATIFKARRAIFNPKEESSTNVLMEKEGNFQDVCIKQIHMNITPEEDAATPGKRNASYTDEINAILYEAYIHALLCKTFMNEGLHEAVPHLYEVVARTKSGHESHIPEEISSVWLVMDLIHGSTLEKYLHSVLKPHQYHYNDRILFDILIQLAYYLHILQERLVFNHRDMKINNLFVRHHGPGWTRRLQNVPHVGTYDCKADLVLIDFGFACISCGPDTPRPRASMISAGSWFRPEDECLKYGRDLGQLLYSLQSHFPFTSYFSTELCVFLRAACLTKTDERTVDILKGINKEGKPESTHLPAFHDGIYVFLRENNTDIEGCKPATFLKGIKNLNGHALTVHNGSRPHSATSYHA